MSKEKTRVDFNAPVRLVEQADTVADVLGISRTQLLIDALQDEIEELATDETFQRRISNAYYAGEIEFETVERVLGTEQASRLKLLRDSLDRDPPEPQLAGDLPTAEEFYEGEPPEWRPEQNAESDNELGSSTER